MRLITPALEAAGWDIQTQIRREYTFTDGHRANKGVFLTTGTFTREAAEYVKNLDKTVVLVDGDRLAELMIEFNLGVTLEQTYEIKRIDSDFFEA